MSRPDRSWTESEKVVLLTEILRDDRVRPTTLFSLIIDHGVSPKWTEIPLPQGRSLNSCQKVFQELSQDDQRLRPHLYGLLPPRVDAFPSSMLQPSPQVPRKRPVPSGEPSVPTARALQPRPSGGGRSNGEESPLPQASPGETMGEPARKKRGRPSKAELDMRKAAAAARGEVYQPPKRRAPKKQDSITTPTGPPTDLDVSTSGVPLAAPAHQRTPTRSPAAPESEGSNGKRKRQRSRPKSQELSKMQIPAVLSSGTGLTAVATVANPASHAEVNEGPLSTIPEKQFGHKTSLEGLLRNTSDHANRSPFNSLGMQPTGTEYTQSRTVQPLSRASNETQQS